ncbi:MAG: serine/threonine protein kinase [Deltaproteobacteria bacterium]|nr:serine/threonine protein kinase [Deltaproteobacteria bacterium]
MLGQGGSGIVYDAAWGPRRVALKVLHPSLVDGERVRAQFLAEAARLQTISHPSVVKVLASGVLPDGRPYLAMERLDGETLAGVLARGPLALPQALALFGELCGAVAALHAQGLVHRDLKPENVFIVRTPEGTQHAVLLDFGIAKELLAPASTTTIDGGVRGTPAYMAPERFFGQPAGVATDIYELAVTFYAMLAGRLPWDDLADPEARLSPRPLVELASVSSELDVEVRRAMSTRAQNRPANAAALFEAVLGAAGAEPTAASETARMKPAGEATTAVPTPISPSGAPLVTRDARPWFAERQATTDRGKTPLAWAPTEAAPKVPAPEKKRRWPLVVAGLAAAGLAAGAVAWIARPAADDGEKGTLARIEEPDLHDDDEDDAPPPPKREAREAREAREVAAVPRNPDDPWDTGDVVDRPDKAGKARKSFSGAIPLPKGPELPVATARAEVARAFGKVPADTQVLMAAVVGDMRHHEQFSKVLDKIAKQPRVSDLLDTVPCLRSIARGSEWIVFAAKSLDEGHHATLIVRGRWRRSDIEACFEHDGQPLTMADGAKLLQLPRLGWVDFIDEHTVYLSVREDLAAAQVHDLVKTGKGPTAQTKRLVAALPKAWSFAAVIDGGNGLVWPERRIPKGSDATAWFHLGEDLTAFDVAVDAHAEAAAQRLVADIKPQFDDVFKDAPPALVGELEVVREQTTFHVRGGLTPFILGMIASTIP